MSRWCASRDARTTCARALAAWVTLVPADPNAPIARVKLNRGGQGEFEIAEPHGPTEGPHRCIVSLVSDIFPHVATGAFSLPDAATWELNVDVRAGQALRVAVDASHTTNA